MASSGRSAWYAKTRSRSAASSAPCFSIEYPVEEHAPRFRVCSITATKHIEGAEDLGGLGFLQIASSPHCTLDVRLEGQLFHVRVDVDAPAWGSSAMLGVERSQERIPRGAPVAWRENLNGHS